MDVMAPAKKPAVKVDHQLPEHGTPDPISRPAATPTQTPPASVPTETSAELTDADVDAMLVQASQSSGTKKPTALIIFTLVIVIGLSVVAWYALGVSLPQ